MSQASGTPSRPNIVYWALTNRCAHACTHCRSRSGAPLPGELDPTELLGLARQLVAMNTRVVVLTGGDPLLHPSWSSLTRVLTAGGVRVRVHTSLHLEDPALDALQGAGVGELVVSLDGPAEVHDRLRPPRAFAGGADHADTIHLLRRAIARGLPTRVVTTASRPVLPHLDGVYETIADLGVPTWQLQQLHLRGRAEDHARDLFPPIDAGELLVRVLARVHAEGRVRAPMHCSVGWMGAEEPVLRAPGSAPPQVWRGSRAGRGGFAITAKGQVRGCPCLPDDPAQLHVRDHSLAEIWSRDTAFPETRGREAANTGACAPCRFGESCQGGCTGLALSYTGGVTENPRCVRALRSELLEGTSP